MSIKNFTKQVTKLLVIGLLFSANSATATLLTFANGGFEGFTGVTNTWNSEVPPGWTQTNGSPDVFDENTDIAGFVWGASSTGGDFLHGIGWQPTWTESAQQLGLSGLVIGQQYEISFEQSIANSSWSTTGGFWRILFGSESQDSALMTLPTAGTFDGWNWQTMLFTATSTTQSLTVSAFSDTDSLRADLGIDSFFIGDPGTNPENPASIPEPESLALFAFGLIGLLIRRKRAI